MYKVVLYVHVMGIAFKFNNICINTAIGELSFLHLYVRSNCQEWAFPCLFDETEH